MRVQLAQKEGQAQSEVVVRSGEDFNAKDYEDKTLGVSLTIAYDDGGRIEIGLGVHDVRMLAYALLEAASEMERARYAKK